MIKTCFQTLPESHPSLFDGLQTQVGLISRIPNSTGSKSVLVGYRLLLEMDGRISANSLHLRIVLGVWLGFGTHSADGSHSGNVQEKRMPNAEPLRFFLIPIARLQCSCVDGTWEQCNAMQDFWEKGPFLSRYITRRSCMESFDSWHLEKPSLEVFTSVLSLHPRSGHLANEEMIFFLAGHAHPQF